MHRVVQRLEARAAREAAMVTNREDHLWMLSHVDPEGLSIVGLYYSLSYSCM
jgi:hypothetical protein